MTPDWMTKGACVGTNPSVFFGEPDKPFDTGPAKAICARCPIIDQCREYVAANPQGGVWAGTTEKEPRQQRARRGRPPSPVEHGTELCYHNGCHCSDCIVAHRAYNRDHDKGYSESWTVRSAS